MSTSDPSAALRAEAEKLALSAIRKASPAECSLGTHQEFNVLALAETITDALVVFAQRREKLARLQGRIEGYGCGSNDAVHRDCCGVGTWLEECRAQLAALESEVTR